MHAHTAPSCGRLMTCSQTAQNFPETLWENFFSKQQLLLWFRVLTLHSLLQKTVIIIFDER